MKQTGHRDREIIGKPESIHRRSSGVAVLRRKVEALHVRRRGK